MNRERETLFFEYGLNVTQGQMILLVAAEGLLWWGNLEQLKKARAISGQAGMTLLSLARRGLLLGPDPGQAIKARPFSLSEAGRDLVGKVERGLHTPAWLSEHKVKALECLDKPHPVAWSVLKDKGVRKVTLGSLTKAGYLTNGLGWEITDLGREALAEWRQANGQADKDLVR
ncbi:MAG: hypothetical protein KJ077_08455 [Anaerolineae bacterium]|nr:hypothetical protein [Anaerolineae bacterium]